MKAPEGIAVVTGASSGIGLETARALAAADYHVAMVVRDPMRGDAAYEAIRSSAPQAKLSLHRADLSSQSEIRTLAAELAERFPRIDRLVNNAGLIAEDYRETVDGMESTWAVNHLAYYLLTRLLLPHLKKAEGARIVSVASEASRAGSIDFENPGRKGAYSALGAYAQSKLANIMFTYELARRLNGQQITANCMHPGGVNTNFSRNNSGFLARAFQILMPLMRSPAQGADTVVWLSLDPALQGVSGKYWKDRKEIVPQSRASVESDCRKLWELSATQTGLPVD